jgi:hypothetical protein
LISFDTRFAIGRPLFIQPLSQTFVLFYGVPIRISLIASSR